MGNCKRHLALCLALLLLVGSLCGCGDNGAQNADGQGSEASGSNGQNHKENAGECQRATPKKSLRIATRKYFVSS